MSFQVQDLGLAPSYKEKQTTYDFIRRLFALPFLPHEHITPSFKKCRKSATTPRLEKLMRYISKNCIKSPTFKPETWCIYQSAIHTNNDVEGWHNRLNSRCPNSRKWYLVVDVLHQEAKLLTLQTQLLSMGMLQRYQRKTYKDTQGGIFTLWDEFYVLCIYVLCILLLLLHCN